MAKELDWPGLVDRIEISESAGITVEQIDDEIIDRHRERCLRPFSGNGGSGAQAIPRTGGGRGQRG